MTCHSAIISVALMRKQTSRTPRKSSKMRSICGMLVYIRGVSDVFGSILEARHGLDDGNGISPVREIEDSVRTEAGLRGHVFDILPGGVFRCRGVPLDGVLNRVDVVEYL